MASGDSTPNGYGFESPIEERFALFADICLRPFLSWKHGCPAGQPGMFDQYEVRTRGVTFRIDFVAQSADGERVGFECDGRDFHQDRQRDLLRDALILKSNEVSAIYRIAGEDIHGFWGADIFRFVLRRHERFFPEHALRRQLGPSGQAIWKEAREIPTGIEEAAEYAIEGDHEEGVEGYMEERFEEEVDEYGALQFRCRMVQSQRSCMKFVPSKTKVITRELRFLSPHATELAALVQFADRHSDLNFSDLCLAMKAEAQK